MTAAHQACRDPAKPRPASTTSFLNTLLPASDPELAAALAAGWKDCDLGWERLQEQASSVLCGGDATGAIRLWRRGWWLALMCFPTDDPRYATSLANAGMAARLAGNESLARVRYSRALRLWGQVPDWVERMNIARRARSSTMHLRLEAAYWEDYKASIRSRAMGFAREAAACLDAGSRSAPANLRLHDHWRGERPAAFDDLRKFLGAALLLAARQSPDRINPHDVRETR